MKQKSMDYVIRKIIGILGVAVIAATLFFTTDVVNTATKDTTLGSLITMNTANANPEPGGGYVRCALVSADLCILTNVAAYQGYRY